MSVTTASIKLRIFSQLVRIGDEAKRDLREVNDILNEAVVPLTEASRVDYTLFTGSRWNAWEQELEEILSHFERIDDVGRVVNALFTQRKLALAEAKRHSGPWPHHFLIVRYDECDGYETYCERCYLSSWDADVHSTPCVTRPVAPNIYGGTEVPF